VPECDDRDQDDGDRVQVGLVADEGGADVPARVALDHRDHVVAALEQRVAVRDDDYDLDGNVKTETHHFGCTSVASCTSPGITTKWYDGADRLVEVQQPYDASDIQQYPWSTRYLYDLSGSGVTAYRGMGLRGYGNLVSTQELLSSTVWTPAAGQTYSMATGSWIDVRATSYDALDRPISSYEAAFGDQPKATNGYDGPGNMGLLSSVSLATGELKSFVYDALGRRTDAVYPNDPSGGTTPGIHEAYDAAGHITSRTTSVLGSETLTYDATGAVTSVTEPASLGGGTIRYGYYADGLRSSAGYSDQYQSYPSALQYAYRADGKRDRLILGNGTAFTWAYTAAGRLQTQTDPLTGTTVHPDATYTYNAKELQKPYYANALTYGPWTQGYDSNGRPATTTLPVSVFSYTGSQYDLDDGIAALTVVGPNPSPPPMVGKFSTTGPLPLMQPTIRNEKNPGTVAPRNSSKPRAVCGTRAQRHLAAHERPATHRLRGRQLDAGCAWRDAAPQHHHDGWGHRRHLLRVRCLGTPRARFRRRG
jgi:YD repeat-containing protein